MLTFVFRLHYKSFAIYASDKSAFCKRQLSVYNMPSIQKEKSSDPLPQGKAPAHVNTVSAWASQPRYGAHSSTGRVHRILLPSLGHAWHWTSVAEDQSVTCKWQENSSSEGNKPTPSRFLVTQLSCGGEGSTALPWWRRLAKSTNTTFWAWTR